MNRDEEIPQAYSPMYDRFENMNRLLNDPPLLAHYTSIHVLEKILQDEEIWFSNPLFMNDLQEMRFGLNEGARLFSNPQLLSEAGGTPERALRLDQLFASYFNKFDNESAFDTYIFCVSEHKKDDRDGVLSMWRGYGAHGNGAALVFNPAKVPMVPNSVLTLATVAYASTETRLKDLSELLNQWCSITKNLNLPDDKLYHAAYAALAVIMTYALTTEHNGFAEEKEWRLIYLAERDTQGLLKHCLSHHIGPRGIEPKMKLKIGPIAGVTSDSFNLDTLLENIILGPSLSTPLAFQSVSRMLEGVGKASLKNRLIASTIPLRATP